MDKKQKIFSIGIFIVLTTMFVLKIVLQNEIVNLITRSILTLTAFGGYFLFKKTDEKNAKAFIIVGVMGILLTIFSLLEIFDII